MHDDQNELTTRLTTEILRSLAKAFLATAEELERSSWGPPREPRWEPPVHREHRDTDYDDEDDATKL
jgi:hypothetical protein